MNAVKLQNQSNKTNLVIVHQSNASPFYYVEEAEIGHSTVSVAFFDENKPDSEIQNETVSTKAILAFANDFYSDVIDFQRNGEHIQETAPAIGMGYLRENLNQVLTDYLNNKEA